MKRIQFKTILLTLMGAGLLAACATTPLQLSALDEARAEVESLVSDAAVRRFAPAELREAESLLERMQERQQAGAERAELLHLAQLTKTQVGIARQAADLQRLEARVAELGNQREMLVVEARAARAEAEAARSEAARMEEAERRTRAEQAASAAELGRRSEAELRAAAQREAQMAQQQRMEAEERAQALAEQARMMQEEADRLQEQIAELEARPTDRGLVLTLGSDVLFDLDQYELRAGAERTVGRIAEFLNEYEDRQVLVEGFTDSTGARDYNMGLSERRADSVRSALVESGVAPERIRTRGYGPDYAVANNDTQAGRQLNRRVEVIISDDNERVPDRVE